MLLLLAASACRQETRSALPAMALSAAVTHHAEMVRTDEPASLIDCPADTAAVRRHQYIPEILAALQDWAAPLQYSATAIPPRAKAYLDCMAGKVSAGSVGFTIANKDSNWNCCCIRQPELPNRQLSFISRQGDILVMSYKTGGIGVAQRLLVLRIPNSGNVRMLFAGYMPHTDSSITAVAACLRNAARKEGNIYDLNI